MPEFCFRYSSMFFIWDFVYSFGFLDSAIVFSIEDNEERTFVLNSGSIVSMTGLWLSSVLAEVLDSVLSFSSLPDWSASGAEVNVSDPDAPALSSVPEAFTSGSVSVLVSVLSSTESDFASCLS